MKLSDMEERRRRRAYDKNKTWREMAEDAGIPYHRYRDWATRRGLKEHKSPHYMNKDSIPCNETVASYMKELLMINDIYYKQHKKTLKSEQLGNLFLYWQTMAKAIKSTKTNSNSQ